MQCDYYNSCMLRMNSASLIMASDIPADECTGDKFEFNGDIFLTSGIMNPKELYLTDLPTCKDVLTDLQDYRGASSSDSGISTMDDFQDVANVTDLNSLLDAHFKELDFSLDFVTHESEKDDVFDPDIDVKSEPLSPSIYGQLHISSDYFIYGDAQIKDEGSPLMLPTYHQFDHLSPVSSSYSPSHKTEPLCETSLPCQHHSPSPKLTLKSQSFQINHSSSTNTAAFSYTDQRKSLLQHLNILPDTPSSPYSSDSSSHCVSPLPPCSSNIIVVPYIKKETQVSIPSPPGGMLASSSKDIKPVLPANFNIDAIINSKVKIQPKPGSETAMPAVTTQWGTTTASNQLQAFPIITSSVISTSSTNNLADEKSLKRAQRIIKNRESASLSRKRKKEYLTSLEERLQQCRDENERLLRENDTLRRQVEYLQRENSGLKNLNMSPAKKICLMCLVFLLALNLSPFSLLNGRSNTNSESGIGQSYHPTGRHLMSLLDDSTERLSGFEASIHMSKDAWSPGMLLQFDEEVQLLAKKLNITEKLGNIYPVYFNSTESNRLAEQLRGWMISQEEEKKKKEKKRHKKKKNYSSPKASGSDAFSMNTQSAVNRPSTNGNTYPVQIFNGGYYSRQQLLNAVPRRNDTFYVLSFSTDYFLVPATAHNKTMRPRMSLLMPVVTPSISENIRYNHDSVGMMQIDCEILNTNLIHLYHSTFSDETLNNSTSYGRNETSGNRTDQNNPNIHPHNSRHNNSDKKPEQNIKYWEKMRKSISG